VHTKVGSWIANTNHRQFFDHYVLGKIHSYDILGAGMLWKPKKTQILTNFIDQPVNIW
jgi:hypothetical protein